MCVRFTLSFSACSLSLAPGDRAGQRSLRTREVNFQCSISAAAAVAERERETGGDRERERQGGRERGRRAVMRRLANLSTNIADLDAAMEEPAEETPAFTG